VLGFFGRLPAPPVSGTWCIDEKRACGGISIAASEPSSGLVSIASTNFTVMLSGATFNGSQTVTINDGQAGANRGLFTPSVGGTATGSVTVTPAAAATGFTFTYTPATTGAITLTFTNAHTANGGALLNTLNVSTAGGNYTLNSAAVGACNFTSATNEPQQAWVLLYDGTNIAQLEPFGTNTMFYDVNDTAFISTAGTFTNYQGQWIATRTASNLVTLYKNGSSVATSTQVSSAMPNAVSGYLSGPPTTNLIGGGFQGAGINSTKALQIFNRLHTYYTSIGAPSGC
jgi:hypothetical protein